jgi:hypothetical protein
VRTMPTSKINGAVSTSGLAIFLLADTELAQSYARTQQLGR